VAVAFAIVSAFCFAASHVTAKRGLTQTSILAGLLIQLASAAGVVLVAVALDLPRAVTIMGILVFAATGLIAPGTARATALAGVDRLGPSVAVPIQQGLRPLVSVAGGALLLGEPVGPLHVVGVLAIALGGWQLSRERTRTEVEVDAVVPRGAAVPGSTRAFKPGIVFPLVTALCYGTTDVVVKAALGEFPYPTFGAFLGICTALAVWGAAALAVPRVKGALRFGPSARWFVASGSFMGLAILSMFQALQRGDVSVVGPIIATQTLAVFLLSTVLLRHVEQVTKETVLAGVVVVAGIALVTG
jgi:drug/metabolite transporter (DMT)-like permease